MLSRVHAVPLTTAERRFVVSAPIVVAVAIAGLYPLSHELYSFVVREYMVVEDLQFLFYVLAMVMSAVLARRLWHAGDLRPLGLLYGAAAVGLFFVAGEEVSWGGELFERIFPWWPGKSELRQVNAQGETTLHNLNGLGHVFTWLLFALAAYGVISPLVRAPLRRWVADRWLDFVVFPRATVPALLIAVLFFVTMLFLTGSHHHVQHGTGEEAFLRYQEVAELDISFSLVVFVLILLRWTTGARLSTGGGLPAGRSTDR